MPLKIHLRHEREIWGHSQKGRDAATCLMPHMLAHWMLNGGCNASLSLSHTLLLHSAGAFSRNAVFSWGSSWDMPAFATFAALLHIRHRHRLIELYRDQERCYISMGNTSTFLSRAYLHTLYRYTFQSIICKLVSWVNWHRCRTAFALWYPHHLRLFLYFLLYHLFLLPHLLVVLTLYLDGCPLPRLQSI